MLTDVKHKHEIIETSTKRLKNVFCYLKSDNKCFSAEDRDDRCRINYAYTSLVAYSILTNIIFQQIPTSVVVYLYVAFCDLFYILICYFLLPENK